MRYIFILTVFCSSIITACSKDSARETDAAITGTWELRQVSDSIQPIDYPAGNGNLLKFTNTVYEIYINGLLTKSGEYKIISDNTVRESVCLEIADGQYTERIIYDNDTSAVKQFIEISGNTLSFIAGCYANDGGHSEKYEKLQSNW
ncbi:MAG TPA: hypothetical protein PL045_01585 [Chitinophagaceae bacterium]|nr:hypothetical protein [Chitinophagaceae bacterium]